ncbi:MAG: 4-hydroxy-tetrahydrodipicolinate synthase [bacterium]|nr:4-hydroxy-tetrahydrodipicolinate synthase [bacterium]MDD5354379.1 4-hydroxy-tetrahydrodipicolinate synthase [bacterium]MDD5756430.1 4-hydroxy-tetrahydrodipicolinate synthase [bacterium]
MFSGSGTAIVTPFANGKVDYEALGKLIESQIKNGIKVLVPCGTTGESATLTYEEHDQVIKFCVQQAKKRVKILAGTGSNSTDEAITLTQYAKDAGADGALLITPYYNKPTQEGMYLHFKKIAETVDIPQVLYNVPGRTSVNLLPETVIRLSKVKNVVGIKEASGNLEQVSQIVQNVAADFTVLSGEDSLTFLILALGGKGVISVVSNIIPADIAAMTSAFEKGDLAKSRALHFKMFELMKAMFIETNPIPVKTAMGIMGICSPEMRLPLSPMAESNVPKLKKVMKDYGLI